MTVRHLTRDAEEPAGRLFAGRAGSLEGVSDRRAPLILLHGLTFDRTMWRPAVAELRELDPGRQIFAVDLPGHGRSPAWPSYDFQGIADAVHRAVRAAKLRAPVLVGHSAGAVVATVYASRHPACGVVNVDQWLQTEPLAKLFQSLAGQLRGPGFVAVWEMVEAGMHIGLLPPGGPGTTAVGPQPAAGAGHRLPARTAGPAGPRVRRGRRRAAGRLAHRPDSLPVRLGQQGRTRLPELAESRASAGQRHGVASERPLPSPRSPAPLRRVPGGHRAVG